MPYDPTIYVGTARHYAAGRPPYSRELAPTLAAELGLDGTGRLLDVGCGPGVLVLELGGLFADVVAVDPDADMLAEGRRRVEAAADAEGRRRVEAEADADGAGVARAGGARRDAVGRTRQAPERVRWVQALAEDLPLDLAPGSVRVAAFGQSFHWTDRERVAEAVYDLLEPGGALAIAVHTIKGHPAPTPGPGHPPIPHEEIKALIRSYLGDQRRAGQGLADHPPDRYEDALARTRFGRPRTIFLPGRTDIVRDVDGVVAGYLSMSYAAPHLFGDRLPAFESDLRTLLAAHTPTGRFWDWPGATELLLAPKP